MLEAGWLPGAQDKNTVFAAQALIALPEAAIFLCRFSISNSSELHHEELTRTIGHTGTGRVWLSESFALKKISEEKRYFFFKRSKHKKPRSIVWVLQEDHLLGFL